MERVYLNIGALPRICSVAPKVHSIASIADHQLMKYQQIKGLHICIRFHGPTDGLCVNIDGNDYQAKYPHIFIKRDGEIHRIADEGVTDAFYFTYHTEDTPVIPDDLTISEIRLNSDIHAIIHNIMELLPHSCESGMADRIDGLYLQLLINLLLQCAHHETCSEDERKIQKILSYLQIHYTDDINFDDIARHFGYSPRSFYRHWKKYHNTTPANYISSLKLAEARRLLKESCLSVEDISDLLKYNSSAYFVYLFRKHIGITPLQYRKTASPD